MTNEQLETIRQRIIKWIEALRSGEYEQGKGCLCDGYRYCCLGVATHIVEEIIVPVTHVVLSEKTTLLYGLRGTNGGFTERNELTNYLSSMNDSGYSFDTIAELISSCPNGLFIPEVEEYLQAHPLVEVSTPQSGEPHPEATT